jgi:hypothetical protein
MAYFFIIFSSRKLHRAHLGEFFRRERENQTKRKIDAVNGLGMPEHLRDPYCKLYFKGEVETEPNCFFLKLFFAFS